MMPTTMMRTQPTKMMTRIASSVDRRRVHSRGMTRYAMKSAKNDAVGAAQAEEDDDVTLGIEPCLVGWNDKDEHGQDVYCCEQPGGGYQCVTTHANEHVECEVKTDADGNLSVDCPSN